jgi:hypothetical protein
MVADQETKRGVEWTKAATRKVMLPNSEDRISEVSRIWEVPIVVSSRDTAWLTVEWPLVDWEDT